MAQGRVVADALGLVPLDEEDVVGQLVEDPLGHRLQRALVDPHRAEVAAADVHREGDVGREALDHPAVELERLLEEVVGVDALAHDRVLARAGVDELDVIGEVELHVARAGADRLGDQLALDGQRVLEQLLMGVVEAIGDALLVERRRQEPRGGGQGDLERAVGDRAQAIGVAHERVVDLAQAPADARHAAEEHLLALRVAKAHRDRAGLDPLDRVVERVGEGRAAELAVGDDVQADVDLLGDGGAHLRVDDLVQGRAVLGALGLEDGRMTRTVELGGRVEEALRAQQAADDLGASGLARRVHPAIFSGSLIVRQRVGARVPLPSPPCSWMPGCRGRLSVIPTARP